MQEILELARALVGPNLVMFKQLVAQLLESRRLGQSSPDPCRDLVEAKASARIRIERHQFVPDIGFHEIDRSFVYWTGHLASLWLAFANGF